jgi:phosphoenolpyruvate-protein phosphotransferase (PTS system enzyme I)
LATPTPSVADNERSAVHVSGTAVSRGIAVGTVVRFYGTLRQYSQTAIDDPETEVSRFLAAVDAARAELNELVASRAGHSSAAVFEVHVLMLDDPALRAATVETIERDRVNAEWALKVVADRFVEDLLSAQEPHLREKAEDVRDVAERVQTHLSGDASTVLPWADSIIVASEIQPSTLISLSANPPIGIATERGGWTSHAFILARELGIPAVAGIRNILRIARDGDRIHVDGDKGELVINPAHSSVAIAGVEAAPRSEPTELNRISDAETADGVRVTIAANAETPESIRRAIEMGADEIGLLRSEYLFDLRRGLPDYSAQVAAYQRSISAAAGKRCRIRTFDVPADRLQVRGLGKEKNPALGLRGIRHALANEDLFRVQISAILEAARAGKVEIVLPLVSSVEEVQRAHEIISDEALKAGVRMPRVGGLIEVPAAVISADLLINHLDFACIGTNDLVQYMSAADRDNDAVASSYQTLHPSVIRSLRTVREAAIAVGKRAIICGEIAGSPYYIPLLLGLGFDSLSMNLTSIPRVREAISRFSSDVLTELAGRIQLLESAAAAEAALSEFHSRHRSFETR